MSKIKTSLEQWWPVPNSREEDEGEGEEGEEGEEEEVKEEEEKEEECSTVMQLFNFSNK